MSQYHRTLQINDLHSGHLLGLTTPDYFQKAYPWQEPFWNFFVDTIKQIGKVDDLVVNGDAVDGPGKKETTSHLTTDLQKQQDMACEIIDQVKADRRHFVRGTGFHVDGDKSYENDIAKEFNTEAHDDLRLEIYGTKFHFKHTVGRSDTPYGQYTQIGKAVIQELLQAEMEDYDSADIICRAHVHYAAGIWMPGKQGRMLQGFTGAGLQLRGPVQSAFTRKLSTWKYDVGVTLIETDKNGDTFVRPFIFPIKNYAPKEYVCLAA